MELCYRIWDYLVTNITNTQKTAKTARLISVYTIMLHQEKSNLIPIFPINSIIAAIHLNAEKVRFDPTTL
jgi:hypothetical protein